MTAEACTDQGWPTAGTELRVLRVLRGKTLKGRCFSQHGPVLPVGLTSALGVVRESVRLHL